MSAYRNELRDVISEHEKTIIHLRAEITRLRAEVEDLQRLVGELNGGRDLQRVMAENERLRAALREAFEVYAGGEGFIPETCAEGYQQQIIKQMVSIISAALEEPSE